MASADDPKVPAKVKREPEANELFRMVMKLEGSDLHLKVGLPPMMRLKGDIRRVEMPVLTQEDMERLLYPPLNDATQRKILDEEGGSRLFLRHRQRRMPLPRQSVQAAQPAVAGCPPRQQQHPQFRQPGPAAESSKDCATSPKDW